MVMLSNSNAVEMNRPANPISKNDQANFSRTASISSELLSHLPSFMRSPPQERFTLRLKEKEKLEFGNYEKGIIKQDQKKAEKTRTIAPALNDNLQKSISNISPIDSKNADIILENIDEIIEGRKEKKSEQFECAKTVPSTPDVKPQEVNSNIHSIDLTKAEGFPVGDPKLNPRVKESSVYLMARPVSRGDSFKKICEIYGEMPIKAFGPSLFISFCKDLNIWKKMRSGFTGGMPSHVVLIGSVGPGKEVESIFTGHQHPKEYKPETNPVFNFIKFVKRFILDVPQLAVSHAFSDFACRDRKAWNALKSEKLVEITENEWKCPNTGIVVKKLSAPLNAGHLENLYAQFKPIDSFRGKQGSRTNYANGYEATLEKMFSRGIIASAISALTAEFPEQNWPITGFIFGGITSFFAIGSPRFGGGFLLGMVAIFRDKPNFSAGYYAGFLVGIALALKAKQFAKGNNCQTIVSTALMDYQEIAVEERQKIIDQELAKFETPSKEDIEEANKKANTLWPSLPPQDFVLPNEILNVGWAKHSIPKSSDNNQSLS